MTAPEPEPSGLPRRRRKERSCKAALRATCTPSTDELTPVSLSNINLPHGQSFAPRGADCFTGFHLETLMKVVLLIVATLLVGYFAIGTGVSATDQVEKRTSHIESVLEQATK